MKRTPAAKTTAPAATARNLEAERIAGEMLDRQERVERATAAIKAICNQERVNLTVSSINLRPDGGIAPVITLVPL